MNIKEIGRKQIGNNLFRNSVRKQDDKPERLIKL